ncbi:MAG: hypothetical protein AB7T49_17630 [Oligoflexales bacterium]
MRAITILLLGILFSFISCKSRDRSSNSEAKAVVTGNEEGPSYFMHKSSSGQYFCIRTCPMGIAGAEAEQSKLYGICKLSGAVSFDVIANVGLSFPEKADEIMSDSVYVELMTEEYKTTVDELLAESTTDVGNECVILGRFKPSNPTTSGGGGGGGGGPTLQTAKKFVFKHGGYSSLYLEYSAFNDGKYGSFQKKVVKQGTTTALGVTGSRIELYKYFYDEKRQQKTTSLGRIIQFVDPYYSSTITEHVITSR